MVKLYCDANPSYLAYVIEGDNLSASSYTKAPAGINIMEAEYTAIIYGLNEYFLLWNKELDARQYEYDAERSAAEDDDVYTKVATPSVETPRQKPPATVVYTDNETVAKQLSRQYHVRSPRLRKLADQIWQQVQNLDVKFQWIPRKENPAGKMLP